MYGLVSENELYHHGVLGMKWGVRRYQNKDGTLTSAGKKRYYKTDEYGFNSLTEHGYAYNRKKDKKLENYSNSVLYNTKKVKKEQFEPLYDKYVALKKEDTKSYDEEFKKWGNGEGKYKGKDYYQFKDMVQDQWVGSDLGKQTRDVEKQIKSLIEEAAKESPLYSKSVVKLGIREPETIKYGEEAVRRAMGHISYNAYSDARASYVKERQLSTNGVSEKDVSIGKKYRSLTNKTFI